MIKRAGGSVRLLMATLVVSVAVLLSGCTQGSPGSSSGAASPPASPAAGGGGY